MLTYSAPPLWGSCSTGEEKVVEESSWREEAKCRTYPSEIFEVMDGSSLKARLTNEIRFAYAETICNKCPVAEECLQSASNDDLRWTVRGGVEPGTLVKVDMATCKSGKHTYPAGSGRCPECRRDHYMSPEYKARRAAKERERRRANVVID